MYAKPLLKFLKGLWNMKRKLLLICLILAELLTAAFGAVGLFMCFRDSGAKILIYYTTDSNVLGVAASLLCAGLALRALISGGDIPRPALIFRLAAACCLAVTFLVTLTVLAPSAGPNGFRSMLLTGSMLYVHLLCPLSSVAGFILFGNRPALPLKSAFAALLPTAVYAAVAIPMNILRLWRGPYFFLLVHDQPVHVSLLWAVGIFAGAYLIALLLLLPGRLAQTLRKEKHSI